MAGNIQYHGEYEVRPHPLQLCLGDIKMGQLYEGGGCGLLPDERERAIGGFPGFVFFSFFFSPPSRVRLSLLRIVGRMSVVRRNCRINRW